MITCLSHLSALQAWSFPLAQQYFSAEIERADGKQHTVFSRADRRRIDGRFPSLLPPRHASHGLHFDHGLSVVSPELMFVQLAAQFDSHQTVILGHLLCSHFAGPISQLCLQKKQLLAFALQAERLHGRQQALRAPGYVEEGACSIMKVFLRLFLSLPHHLGGLALSGGVFNDPIEVDAAAGRLLGQKLCSIDYYFPALKLGYE